MMEQIRLKYYRVTAKCGHVGRGRFCLKPFFVRAENGKDAANKVRYKGRVKHDHKDAIAAVDEVSEAEFMAGLEAKKKDPYFLSFNVQQQRQSDSILEDIRREPQKAKYGRGGEDRKKKLAFQHRLERKQNKHLRYYL